MIEFPFIFLLDYKQKLCFGIQVLSKLSDFLPTLGPLRKTRAFDGIVNKSILKGHRVSSLWHLNFSVIYTSLGANSNDSTPREYLLGQKVGTRNWHGKNPLTNLLSTDFSDQKKLPKHDHKNTYPKQDLTT